MVWQNSRQSYCQWDCKTVGKPTVSIIAMHCGILLQYSGFNLTSSGMAKQKQSYCQSDCKTVGNPSASRIVMHWGILMPVCLQYSRQTTATWKILISCHINFRMINVSDRNFECALQQFATNAGLVIKILLPDKNPTGNQDPRIHHYFPVWGNLCSGLGRFEFELAKEILC